MRDIVLAFLGVLLLVPAVTLATNLDDSIVAPDGAVRRLPVANPILLTRKVTAISSAQAGEIGARLIASSALDTSVLALASNGLGGGSLGIHSSERPTEDWIFGDVPWGSKARGQKEYGPTEICLRSRPAINYRTARITGRTFDSVFAGARCGFASIWTRQQADISLAVPDWYDLPPQGSK